MKNYDFDKVIDRRGTHCFKWDSPAMCDDPDLIPLFVADMDFQTAPGVVEALTETARSGVYGYTMVWDGYRRAVQDWMKKRHAWDIEKDWIVPFPGVVPAIRLAVELFTRPEDQILVFKPVYYPFDAAVKDAGRKLTGFAMNEKDGYYSIDFEKLDQVLAEEDIRMIILCSPHNPVGRVWTEEELKKLGELCIKHNVFLFSDEIHMDFTYDHHAFIPMLKACPEMASRMVAATAPSKTFNLAGLQTSNMIIPDPEIRKRWEEKTKLNGVSAPNLFGLKACEAAYNTGGEWLDHLLKYVESNFDFMQSWFKENLPEVKMRKPEGLYLAWVDFRDLGMDKEELEQFMLKNAHVWLDEGYIFGEEGSGWERFNCACPRPILKEALERIKTAWEYRNQKPE